VRVSHWVTSFGFAINLEGDHAGSSYVRPCGLEGVKLRTLEEILGEAPPRSRVIETAKECFESIFGRNADGLPEDLLPSLMPSTETGPIDDNEQKSLARFTG
jgi:lipoate-protein ligase B